MRRLVVGVAIATLLAGCAAPERPPSVQDTVEVDSADARAIKARAGIPDCPEPSADPHSGSASSLPALTLPCLGGGRDVDLSTLEGPVFINFFYAACEPCREEMPILARYAREHPEVTVIGIDTLDPFPEAALELAQVSGVTYPLLADPDGEVVATEEFGAIRGFPFNIFLNADGTLSAPHNTFTSLAEVEDFVASGGG